MSSTKINGFAKTDTSNTIIQPGCKTISGVNKREMTDLEQKLSSVQCVNV